MSRGPGKAQRLILDTLKTRGQFYLAALSDGDMGSRYKSLHRAAVRLQEEGKIETIHFMAGRHKVVITPVGTSVAAVNRDQVRDTSQQIEAEVESAAKMGRLVF